MDPNATVEEIRSLLDSIAADAERLEELMQALGQWRRNGGFMPKEPLTVAEVELVFDLGNIEWSREEEDEDD
jgi:hypothetical protein